MKQLSYEEILAQLERADGRFVLFAYTPICGTCKVAYKMLEVIEAMKPELEIVICNLNVMPKLAEQLQIESVPYLAQFDGGEKKVELYAFESVIHLLEQLS